jgi:hypothetical protein
MFHANIMAMSAVNFGFFGRYGKGRMNIFHRIARDAMKIKFG